MLDEIGSNEKSLTCAQKKIECLMFFDNHQDFKHAQINRDLLWEYDWEHFDFQKEVSIVIHRVIERGSLHDFFAMFNLYGLQTVKETIKGIPSFSQRELEFIHNVLGIPYSELTAYKNMKEFPARWPHTGVKIRL